MLRPVLIAILFSIPLAGTGKKESRLKSGLFLTFDDRNMINWEKQIPLFAKYKARVTFFVDHFDELTPEQILALHKLKNGGHAIGCHGLRHLKAAEYCEKYSVEKYISEEVEPAIRSMDEKGFRPACFAYPSSNHSDITNSALLNYFRHLRSGCGITGNMEKTEKAFVRIKDLTDKGCLNGISFHPKSRTDELVIQAKKALDRIKRNGEILVLYAHDIRNENESGPKNFISVEALEEILAYAATKHIKLYSFDELQ